MTENHFGPSAVNVITKTCSGEIRTVSQAQETKVHQTRSDFSVLVSQPSAGQGMKVLQLSVGAGPGGRVLEAPTLGRARAGRLLLTGERAEHGVRARGQGFGASHFAVTVRAGGKQRDGAALTAPLTLGSSVALGIERGGCRRMEGKACT